MQIKVSELEDIVSKILDKKGFNSEQSEIIKKVLMYAQLRGNNQGIVKLPGKNFNSNPDAGAITVVKETKLSAVIDGAGNPGMIVLQTAVDMAVQKAKEHGFGMVGTHNTNSSTGAIGYFASEIASQGLIGFVFAGSPETVATYGSYEPIFGTNPLAIGMPSANDPIVLDMTTAAMAFYGLVEAKTAGKSIPENTAYDAEGKVTTDPEAAMDGALMPFDRGNRGAGLSMMVQILTGPLVGASFTGIGDTKNNWGNLVYVIDPELMTDIDTFKQSVSQMAEKVKSTKKLPSVEEIFVPGERGNKLTKERLDSDSIEIEDNLYNSLMAELS